MEIPEDLMGSLRGSHGVSLGTRRPQGRLRGPQRVFGGLQGCPSNTNVTKDRRQRMFLVGYESFS